jgi:hypothetical protein
LYKTVLNKTVFNSSHILLNLIKILKKTISEKKKSAQKNIFDYPWDSTKQLKFN